MGTYRHTVDTSPSMYYNLSMSFDIPDPDSVLQWVAYSSGRTHRLLMSLDAASVDRLDALAGHLGTTRASAAYICVRLGADFLLSGNVGKDILDGLGDEP